MNLYTLDPMLDGRWDELVAAHPNASVFHQMGWLKALARSYGYRPLVLTSTPPGTRLLDGIVFCEIKSWITGSRLVSVPFADHVEPLLSKSGSLELTGWFNEQWREESWKYIELRPLSWGPHSNSVLTASQS